LPDLFPTFPEIEIYDQAEVDRAEGYLPAHAFSGGDFVLDGTGRIKIRDGEEAWKQWCVKCLCTQKGAHAAYGDDYGIEGEEALQEPTRAAVQSHLERTITEALLLHPFTIRVYKFEFSMDENNDLQVSFIVEGADGASFDYEMSFAAG